MFLSRAFSRVGAKAARTMPAINNNATRSMSLIPKKTEDLSTIKAGSLEEFTSRDGLFEDYRLDQKDSFDPTGRVHHYAIVAASRMMWATVGRLAVCRLVGQWQASADVVAAGTVEVDIASVDVGNTLTVMWRGMPVFVKHRTDAEIARAEAEDSNEMRDPQTDSERVTSPEWLIVLGICTHLGCVPQSNAGDYGGWYCPCHGSHYDLSGRIRKGPAPLNLEIPEYRLDGTTLTLG